MWEGEEENDTKSTKPESRAGDLEGKERLDVRG